MKGTSFLLVLFLAAQAGYSNGTKVDYVSPNYGGTNGATRLMIHGSSFPVDLSLTSNDPDKEVRLINSFNEYDCEVHQEESDETQLVCYTRPMEAGTYRVRVRSKGIWLNSGDYCNNNWKDWRCSFYVNKWRTPLISALDWVTGEPQSVLKISGRIHTTLTSSAVDASENGETARIVRVWMTSGTCELFNGTDNLLGVELSSETSRWGYLNCKISSSYVGNQNISFIVDGSFGRSLSYLTTRKVSADDRIYMIQTYAVVDDVSPKEGGTLGGTILTVTGNYFDNLSGIAARVLVGGSECDVKSVTDTEIKCTTPQITAKPLYSGGRGFLVEVFLDETNIDSDLSAVTPSFTYFQDSSHFGTINHNSFLARIRGFFVPARTGNYKFSVKADDEAKLYLNKNGQDPATKELIVESASGSTYTDSVAVLLNAGTEYYFEIRHVDHTSSSHVHLKVYGDTTDYTPDETSWAVSDEHTIGISSDVVQEQQTVAFEQWATQTAVNSVWELTLVCSDPCVDAFQLKLFETSTVPIPYGSEPSAVESALNNLIALNGETVSVTGTESTYTITFSSPRGKMPLIAQSSGASLTVDATETTEGVPDLNTVTFQVNGYVSESVAYDANEQTVANAVKGLFGPKCPPEIESGLAANYLSYLNMETESASIATRSSEDSFCGLYSAKNPAYLYNDVDGYSAAQFPSLCFAYNGDISDQIRITYRYVDFETDEVRTSTLERFYNVDFVNTENWKHVCVDINALLTGAQPNGGTFQVLALYVTAGSDADRDLYVDNVLISSTAKYNTNERDAHINRIRPSAVPSIKLSTVTVVKTAGTANANLTYQVTFEPIDCGNNFPLLGVAFGTKNTVSPDEIYDWGSNSKVRVQRNEQASTPVTGTFDLSFESGNYGSVSGISSSATEEDLETQIENMNGINDVDVERSGTCYGYSWKVTFKSPGGKYPTLSVTEGNLMGNNPTAAVTQGSEGGLIMDPAYGDFFRTAHEKPQVQVFINNVPSHCKGLFDTSNPSNCNFEMASSATPQVTNIAPLTGAADTEITIEGSGFDASSNIVLIGGVECTPSSESETSITCILGKSPSGAQAVSVQAPTKGFSSIPTEMNTFTVNGGVTTITPSSGSTAGCTTVTIAGTGFDSSSTVLFGTQSCEVTEASYSSITCTTTAGSAGTVDVTVTTAGSDVTSSAAYEYSEASTASVTDVTPLTVTVDGGTNITITGTNFGTTKGKVNLSGHAVDVVSWTDTQIVVKSPPLSAGNYNLNVILNDIGCATGTNVITYELSVTSINPITGSLVGGTELTVTGTGFTSGMKVLIGETPCDVTAVTPTETTCTTQSSGVTHLVTNDGKHPTYGIGYGWEPSNLEIMAGDKVTFTWSVPEQVEGVNIGLFTIEDGLSKNPDNNGFNIAPSVSGSHTFQFNTPGVYNFGSGCVDDVNTCAIFMRGVVTVTDATSKTGNVNVVFGEAKYQFDSSFTFEASTTPVITLISPTSGTIDQQITLTGTGLNGGTVTIGGKVCEVQQGTNVQLVCQIQASEELSVGVYHEVKVLLPNVGLARMEIRNVQHRSYVLLPQVTSIAPVSGSLSGGTKVTIEGSGFSYTDNALTVAIATSSGDVGCTVDVSQSTYTSIKCETESVSSAISGSVAVKQKGLQANCSGDCSFAFNSASTPEVTSRDVSPSADIATTGLTFHGLGFGTETNNVEVFVGPVSCSVTSVTDTQIECSLGRYPVGPNNVNVRIVGKGYPSFVSASDKQIENSAQIDGISPTAGSEEGGTIITITGNGFVEGETSVMIGDQTCEITSTSYATVQCTTAAHAGASLDLVVTSNGQTYPVQTFEFTTAATPTVTTISPNQASGGDTITITGTGFGTDTNAVTVTTGGIACSVTAVTDTSVECTLGEREGGAAQVKVQVGGKGLSKVTATFSYSLRIDSITPNSGSYGGSQEVAVDGVGFSTNTKVTVCDKECNIQSTTPTSITCLTPPANDGATACDVKVLNGDDVSTGSGLYTYDASLTPTITSVSPARGGTGGGTELTITGTNFKLSGVDPSVSIDGSPCTVSSATDTSITCTTSSHQSTIQTKVAVHVGTNGIATQNNADFYYIDLWSSIFTWGGTTVPTTQDFVVIPQGKTVMLDTDTAVLKMLLIDGGTIIFDEKDVKLSSENILIVKGGKLQIGTEEEPFQHKAEIVMYGHLRSPELPIYGAKTLGVRNGTLDMHGKHIPYTWSLLSSTAAAGSTQITVKDPVHWKADDLIVIASTGLRHSQIENELRTITAISSDGRTLTLNQSLEYEHLGQSETFGSRTVEFRAEVGLLTRNILFRGSNDHVWHDPIEKCEEGFQTGQFAKQTCFQGRFGAEVGADQFGASIMIHPQNFDSGEAVARIEYVEVNYAGQAFRLGRYPIHWHLMGNVSGMYVRGCGIHQTFNRAVTIHGTHNLLVERNVIYNIMGGAFFIEDGIETQNVLQYNLAVFVKQSTSLLNDDITPAAYWVTNPDNVLRHNHAAGGTHFGFWYRMHEHPDGPSFTPNVCQQNVELGQFENNTVHSQGWFGLWIFQTYTPVVGGVCGGSEPSPAKFKSLTTWHCEKGAEWVNCGAIQFHDFVMVNNEVAGLDLKLIKGTPWGEEKGALIKNTLVVGHSDISANNYETNTGIILPFGPGLLLDGVDFFNFDRSGVAYGVTSIQGTCTFRCGGYYYWLQNQSFQSVPRKVRWRWEHEGVLEDRDSSFTGDEPFTKVVPYSGLVDIKENCRLADEPYNSGLTSAICKPEIRFHRFALNNVLPSSLEANDLVFANQHGNSSGIYEKKRLTHKPGYMLLLPSKEHHTMHFKDGEQFTNITYNSRFYDFMAGDYLTVSHKFTQRPDKIFMNGEARYNISNAQEITDATIPSLQNLDWHYSQDNKVFRYLIKGKESSRKKRASIEIKDDNFQHTTVSPQIYRCFYEDCIAPPDPSEIPPDRERPEGSVLWSDETTSCINRTDTSNPVVLADCWVVVDVPEITVDSLTINGVLEFETSTTVSAITILVTGRLIAGFSDTNYFGPDLTIRLRGNHATPAVALPGVNLGSKALGCFGGCDLHGKTEVNHWVKLAQTASAGATSIVVSAEVDWDVGDEIVITTTGYSATETEKHVIASVSGNTIGLAGTLAYRHLGESYNISGFSYEMAAEVGILTRNIKIIGEEYPTIDQEAFGARVLVGRYTSGGVSTTGWARLSNVEFHRTGQEGWTETYDPRFSLAWLNTGNVVTSRPSYVKGCAFHDGYSTAIGTFGANGISITDNVVHRTIHDGIRITGSNHILERNLVTVSLFRGAYLDRLELTNFKDWQANFEVSQATDLIMNGNAASGCERLCYHIDGEACDAGEENAWTGNVAHGGLHGVQIFIEDGIGSCSMIRNFVIYKAWDYGIYHQTATSVVVRNTVIIDSTVGYLPLIFGPAALTHQYVDKHATMENVLCVGRSDTFDPTLDVMDEGNDKNLIVRAQSPSKKAPLTPTGGKTCVMLPLFASGPNGAPFKPFNLNKNYPAIHGLLNISGLTAYSYKQHGTTRDLVFYTNPSNEDAFHPTYVERMKLIDVEQESKIFIDRPSPGKVNPSDCVDMECDAKKKVFIKDLDGTFLGEVGAVIPQAEYGWDDPDRISLGLGDYRIPLTMVTGTDGSRIPVSEIADNRGIIRSDTCNYIPSWQAYDCHGVGTRDYAMLVMESLDDDTETRRLSPVALLGDRYIDLNNGPQDHGWCFGYTCQKRISTFYLIVSTNTHFNLFCTGYTPRQMRFHLLNVADTDTVRLGIFVARPERLDVYRSESEVFVHAENSYYDSSNNVWAKRRPSANNPDEFKPAINSGVNGANYMDPNTRIMYLTIRGNEPVEIKTSPLVEIKFSVAAQSIDDFFGENIVTNLAAFLDVPKHKIRVVDIVAENSRKRRSTSREKRATTTYEVTLEFGDEITNNTNFNSSVELDPDTLNNKTNLVLLHFQQGDLPAIVNASVIGMSSQSAATNSTDYNQGIVVHKVPTTMTITLSDTVEELTAFPTAATVTLKDDQGEIVDTLGGNWMITVSLDKSGSNADSSAVLSGQTTVPISNGSATFSDLTISHAGQGYILRFEVSQPSPVMVGAHNATVTVNQRTVHPVFTSGIGSLYNHDDDVIMTLQLRDSSGNLLQNIGHKGLSWHATVSLDDDVIYGTSNVSGVNSFTFDATSGLITTTGLKITNTQRYHKYNLLYRVYTNPPAYDMNVLAEPVQFHSAGVDSIHSASAATQTARVLINSRPYTNAQRSLFKVFMYNEFTDLLTSAYIGSLDVADTTDVNTEVIFDLNAESTDHVTRAVENLKNFIEGSQQMNFKGNEITFASSQCGLTVDTICLITTTSTTSTTASSTTTTSITTTTAPAATTDSTWVIIGVAIGVSVLLAAGAIGLACYLKRYPRSKVGPCMGGSQASLGNKSLIDSIPSQSPNATPSSDGHLYHRPASSMTPVHI